MDHKSRRAEYAEATREALITAARGLFAEQGFSGTSIEDLASAARVTRGALYHHFEDKAALFLAVGRRMEEEIGLKIMDAATQATNPWQRLVLGVDAFLDACLEPDMQRICILEAPTVLGWERWHEIEEEFGLGLVQGALQAAMDSGDVARQPVGPLARMLLGALNEGALYIARSADRSRARREVGETMKRLLEHLRTP